jgi:nucleoid DNA-binding protein
MFKYTSIVVVRSSSDVFVEKNDKRKKQNKRKSSNIAGDIQTAVRVGARVKLECVGILSIRKRCERFVFEQHFRTQSLKSRINSRRKRCPHNE